MTAALVAVCMETAGVAVCVAVLLRLGWHRHRASVQAHEDDGDRLVEGLKLLAATAIDPTIVVARSPLIAERAARTRHPSVQTGNHARLDQQARHAAVVTATGPITRAFDRIVEDNTGRKPRGRGPREADLRQAAPGWQQPDLFAEVAR
jgi:hypothetical protein